MTGWGHVNGAETCETYKTKEAGLGKGGPEVLASLYGALCLAAATCWNCGQLQALAPSQPAGRLDTPTDSIDEDQTAEDRGSLGWKVPRGCVSKLALSLSP